MVNFAAKLAMFPYFVPLSIRERINKFDAALPGCVALRLAFCHIINHTINALWTPRNMPLTSEIHSALSAAQINHSSSPKWAVAGLLWRHYHILRTVPGTQNRVRARLVQLFGFAPCLFGAVPEKNILGLLVAFLDECLEAEPDGKICLPVGIRY